MLASGTVTNTSIVVIVGDVHLFLTSHSLLPGVTLRATARLDGPAHVERKDAPSKLVSVGMPM